MPTDARRLRTARRLVLTLAALVLPGVIGAQQPATPRAAAPAAERYVVEYYYKVKWGHQQEFIDLFRRNHLPLLQARVQRGTMTDVSAVAPRFHATEDGRWDYRVTITFPSAAVAAAVDLQEEVDRRRLYPDTAAFAREERRRFEILDAHWDVPLVPVTLTPNAAARP